MKISRRLAVPVAALILMVGSMYLDAVHHSVLATSIPDDMSEVTALKWSPNGAVLAVGHETGSGRFEIIDPVAHSQLYEEDSPTVNVSDIAWNPDSSQVAISQGIIKIFNATSFVEHQFIPSNDPNPSDNASPIPNSIYYDHAGPLAWSPDGKKIIFAAETGSTDVSLLLGNTQTYQALSNIYIGDEYRDVTGLSWNRLGTEFVGANLNGQILVWNVSASNEIAQAQVISRYPPSDYNPPVTAYWSPDGNLIASVDDNGFVNVFVASTGQKLWEYDLQDTAGITYPAPLSWSPDSTHFAIGYKNDIAIFFASNPIITQIIDIQSGTSVTGSQITALAWSPNGSQIAYGTYRSSLVNLVSVAADSQVAEVPTDLPPPQIAIIDSQCLPSGGATWLVENRTHSPISIHWVAETSDPKQSLVPMEGDINLAPVNIFGVFSPDYITVDGYNDQSNPNSTPPQTNIDLKLYVNGSLVLTSEPISCTEQIS